MTSKQLTVCAGQCFDFDCDDNDDIEESNNYSENEVYESCAKCSCRHKHNWMHCCKCGDVWFNKHDDTLKNIIYCVKCYPDNKIYFNDMGLNVTFVIDRYNGDVTIYNIYGHKLFTGYMKNGQYCDDGVMYELNNDIRYTGDFLQGKYNGFGTFIENNKIKTGVFNDNVLKLNLKTYVKKDRVKTDFCTFCATKYNNIELFPICGSTTCTSKCCIKCIKLYFETNSCSRGATLTCNVLLCPFCRKDFELDVIRIYNEFLERIIPFLKKLKSHREIVGLCTDCDKNEIHELNIECNEQHNKEKYVCAECLESKTFENVKKCPSCNVKVYRIDGCHFIKCRCKKAWCWHCRGIFEITDAHSWNCKLCGQ